MNPHDVIPALVLRILEMQVRVSEVSVGVMSGTDPSGSQHPRGLKLKEMRDVLPCSTLDGLHPPTPFNLAGVSKVGAPERVERWERWLAKSAQKWTTRPHHPEK